MPLDERPGHESSDSKSQNIELPIKHRELIASVVVAAFFVRLSLLFLKPVKIDLGTELSRVARFVKLCTKENFAGKPGMIK